MLSTKSYSFLCILLLDISILTVSRKSVKSLFIVNLLIVSKSRSILCFEGNKISEESGSSMFNLIIRRRTVCQADEKEEKRKENLTLSVPQSFSHLATILLLENYWCIKTNLKMNLD